MNSEEIQGLIRIRIEQSHDCLDAAHSLILHEKSNRAIVNRAYYAAFYSLLALLQTQEKTSKKHIGVIRLFDMEFIKTGKLPKHLSKWLHRLFENRMEDDYQSIAPVTPEEARSALETAEQFVKAIQDYLIHEEFYQE